MDQTLLLYYQKEIDMKSIQGHNVHAVTILKIIIKIYGK